MKSSLKLHDVKGEEFVLEINGKEIENVRSYRLEKPAPRHLATLTVEIFITDAEVNLSDDLIPVAEAAD